jgi:hypothetical protein
VIHRKKINGRRGVRIVYHDDRGGEIVVESVTRIGMPKFTVSDPRWPCHQGIAN